jgi:hypothetical protein
MMADERASEVHGVDREVLSCVMKATETSALEPCLGPERDRVALWHRAPRTAPGPDRSSSRCRRRRTSLAPAPGQADPKRGVAAVVQLGLLAAVIVYFARDLFAVAAARDAPRSLQPDGQPDSPRGRDDSDVVAGRGLQDFNTGATRGRCTSSRAR